MAGWLLMPGENCNSKSDLPPGVTLAEFEHQQLRSPDRIDRTVAGSLILFVVFATVCPAHCLAQGSLAASVQGATADAAVSRTAGASLFLSEQPSGRSAQSDLQRVLLLRDYNTRVVVLGTMLLGLAAGTVGSFTLLRRRALMGDALSHATLPGICLAFMLAPLVGLNGKSLPVLLTGAALSGLAGVASILLIRNLTRLREDAALGIVLSVSFGAGIALLSIIQQSAGHAAGLESFIYGKTASMVAADAWLIGLSGLFCVAVMLLSFKELTLLCFDEGFAGSRGFPVILMDMVLMAMVVIVTIIGLQAVGLVLMIAMLVIPAAAARFWTENIRRMTVISAGLGAFSGLVGSGLSAVFPRLPSGAMIVLICSASFFVSMLCGPARGVIVRFFRRWSLNRSVNRQHLLRGIYEYLEAGCMIGPADVAGKPVPFSEILRMRSWSAARLIRQISRSARQGLVVRHEDRSVSLTQSGSAEAARLVHEHRLWELYLITHAEMAPSRVDRDADTIEHVLDAAMIQQLEDLLEQRQAVLGVVRSPHPVPDASADSSIDPPGSMNSSRNAGPSEIRREGL